MAPKPWALTARRIACSWTPPISTRRQQHRRLAAEFVWVEGYWYPVRHKYKWHSGYWTRPPYEGAHWIAPRHDGRMFFEGYWEGDRGRFEHNHKSDRDHDRDFRNRDRDEDHGK